MAKTCTVCKQSYPDHEPFCPHCGPTADKTEHDGGSGPPSVSSEDWATLQLDQPDLPVEIRSEPDFKMDKALQQAGTSWEDLTKEKEEEVDFEARANLPPNIPTPSDPPRPSPWRERPPESDIRTAQSGGEAAQEGRAASPPRKAKGKPAQETYPTPKVTKLSARAKPSTHLAKPGEAQEEAKAGQGPGLPDDELVEVQAEEGGEGTPSASEFPSGLDMREEAIGSGLNLENPDAAIDDVVVVEGSSEVGMTKERQPDGAPSSGLDLIDDAMQSSRIPRGQFVEALTPRSSEEIPVFLERESRDADEGESSAVDLGSSLVVELPSAVEPPPRPMGGPGDELEHVPMAEGVEEEEGEAIPTHSDSALEIGEMQPFAADTEAEGEAPAVLEPVADSDLVTKPARKAKAARERKGGGLLVGGLVGTLVGAAAVLGLTVTDVIPVTDVKKMVGMDTPAPKTSNPGTGAGKTATVQTGTESASVQSARVHLSAGNSDKALEILQQVDKEDADKLAARGEARWLAYLRKQRQANLPLDPNGKEVQEVRADLEKADTVEALFWLGQMLEAVGDQEGARIRYTNASNKVENIRDKKAIQANLERMQLQSEGQAPGENPKEDKKSQLMPGPNHPAGLAGLFLVALQDEQPAPAPKPAPKAKGAPAETEEAGIDFWKAIKSAKEQKYDQALLALEKARKAHDQRRFLHLRKSQNPYSDPTEEIFLRSCEELRAYWEIRAALEGKSYVTKNETDKTMSAVLKDLAASKEAAVAQAAVVEKLKKDKDVAAADPELKDITKGVDLLLQNKKNADDQLAAARTGLEKAKFVTAQQKDLVKGFQELLKDQSEVHAQLQSANYATEEDPNTAKGVQKLLTEKKANDEKLKTTEETLKTTTAQLQEADGTLKEVNGKLSPKFVPAGANRAQLVQAVDQLLKDSASPVATAVARVTGDLTNLGGHIGDRLIPAFDLTRRVAASEAQVAQLEARQLQSRGPKEMLDIWVPILQERARKDLAVKAASDAARVVKDPGTDAAVKAQALAVEGLALRNQGKFDEARKALQEAVQQKGTGEWQAAAQQALKELTEPGAYYIPEAEKLQKAGKTEAALEVLKAGLEAFPADSKKSGALLARHGLLALDVAKAKGKVSADDPLVVEALKAAEAAVAAGAPAEGHYAAGRVAEALGDREKAQQRYQQAVDAHPGTDMKGCRYRIALARVLVGPVGQPAAVVAPPAAPAKPPAKPADAKSEDAKSGRLPGQEGKETLDFTGARALLAALVIMAEPDEVEQPEAPAPANPDLDKAIELADKAIRGGDPEGHLVKGLALAKKGMWTEALKEYVEGMQKLTGKSERTAGLQYLVENHPAFKVPDALKPPDPNLGAKHYGLGLTQFYANNYRKAEKEFATALRYDKNDARYLYFFALALFQQDHREDAIEAVRQGYVLERAGKPGSAAVNASLERIQGYMRDFLNQYRQP